MKKYLSKLNLNHYAWVICLGCAIVFYATCGMVCNVFPVYSPFIREQWSFTNSQVSMIGTVRSLFQMFAIYLAGKFYKNVKVRKGMLMAGLVCASGHFVYAMSASFPMYLVGSALAGFGYGLTSMVAVSILISRWFVKNRTLAVSLVSAASGLSTIGIPSLITSVIKNKGLSTAFLMEGILMVVLVIAAFLILRESPEEMGLTAFGAEEVPVPEASAEAETKVRKKEPHLKGMNVLLIYALIILGCSYNYGCYNAISMLSTTEGYDPALAAVALSAAGAMLTVGKLVFGTLSTKLSLFKTSVFFMILCMLSTLALCFVRLSPALLLCGAGLLGFSITVLSVGPVTWTEDWFPTEERLEMIRRTQVVYSIGGLVNTMLPGVTADLFGGSYIPFYVFSTVCAVITIAILVYTYKSVRWY